MVKFFRALFFCLCSAILLTPTSGQVVISEILAENEATAVSGLLDEDRERSDWLELYNAGAASVDLAGWSLTDDPLVPEKWKFPSTNILANGYLVVFASGKNRAIAGRQLHTSFKLSAGGEYLALVKGDGKTISFAFAPEFPQQDANISYGLAGGSLTARRFFATPTPGSANPAGLTDRSPDPIFSSPPGVYSNSVTISLSAPHPDAVIRYTVNGSIPTTTSPAFSTPLTFSTSVVVRAKAFVPGLVASTTVTRTFVVCDASIAEFSSNLPILVLSTFGRAPNEGSPIPISATLIGTNGTRAYLRTTPDHDLRGTIKIRGSSSTQFPKKSFAFELQDELGLDRTVSLLGMPKESDWVLYAPYTDKTLMRDFLAYELSNGIGTYAPRTRFIEVYIDQNGSQLRQIDYVGVYVLIEKIKRDDNRVALQELQPSQTTQPEVSGGYIFKKDRLDPGDSGFSTTRAGIFGYVEPKEQEIVSAQRSYLSNYLKSFEIALYAANFTNKNYANFYDVAAGIDHHLMVESTKNIDGYRLSTYVHKDRGGKVTMGPIWDYNLTLGNADYLEGYRTNGWYYPNAGDYPWYTRLFQDPDFNQQYIDRWAEIRKTTFNSANLLPRVIQIADNLGEAAARNYAKWKILGSYVWPNAPGFNARRTYRAEVDWMTNWIRGRHLWMDRQFPAIPLLSHPGGMIEPGLTVTIAMTNTLPVYYTTDGSDPRLPGSKISPTAIRYEAPFVIDKNARVFARSKSTNTTAWSAPATATYITELPKVAVTEIMYNPSGDPEQKAEFIELQNAGDNPIDLNGFRFTAGISFVFTNSVPLNPGAFAVIAKDPTVFVERYGVIANLAGPFVGNLDNAGERIILEGPMGEPILDFTYNNAWYLVTDGKGFSLVVNEVHQFPNSKENWRPSARIGGSPGQVEPFIVDRPKVFVNEILTHTDPPQVDAIEIFNAGERAIDIENWYLTDDRSAPKKFRIPGPAMIEPNRYLVFTEEDFNKDPSSTNSFALSSDDDEIYLFSGDAAGNLTGYSDGFEFGAAAKGVSFGRYVTSDGEIHYPALKTVTLDAPNSDAIVGDVVINEIRYAPLPFEAAFIELRNLSSGSVKLYDPDRPTNTWRLDGLDFNFPTNVSIPGNGFVLIVQNDPARFRATNNVPESVQVFGPYGGTLQANGERIELQRPDAPLTLEDGSTRVPMIVVDEVRFNDKAPWPLVARGVSIERNDPHGFGNEPLNWAAAVGATPGLENRGDLAWGLWQRQMFNDAELADPLISGETADPDQDGIANRDEFSSSTDPKNGASALNLDVVISTAPTLQFEAAPDRTYTIYFRASLTQGAWTAVGVQRASSTPRVVQISAAQPGYYRVAVP